MKRSLSSAEVHSSSRTPLYQSDPSDAILTQLHRVETEAEHDPSRTRRCQFCLRDFVGVPCIIPSVEQMMCPPPDVPILGEGCFCRPECAAGYLKRYSYSPEHQEQMSRLQMLYSPNRQDGIHIRPAPEPSRLLKCLYGELTHEEYHQMVSSNLFLTSTRWPISIRTHNTHEEEDENTTKQLGGTFHINRKRVKVQRSKIMFTHQLDGVAT